MSWPAAERREIYTNFLAGEILRKEFCGEAMVSFEIIKKWSAAIAYAVLSRNINSIERLSREVIGFIVHYTVAFNNRA